MAKKPETMYLGKQVHQSTGKLDRIEWKGNSTPTITLHCTEFTSHCPVTRQPDFATLEISYQPGKYIVETKSMKLFLWTFRERFQFNELLVDEIATEFNNQIKPAWIQVRGKFFTRGGIAVESVSELGKKKG